MQSLRGSPGETNVGGNERLASLVGGGALLLYTVARRPRAALPLALGSGYLLYRGLTGKDLIYRLAGIRRYDAGIRVARALTINRSRAEVYRFWRDFGNLPRFMKHLESVRLLDAEGRPAHSHWVARAPLGRTVEWEAEIDAERENELIAWRSLPGSDIENQGRVEFRDAPGRRGTEIFVSLVYQPPAGSAGAVVARLFGEEPEVQVREDLRRLKQLLEAGEIPTTEGQTSGRVKQVRKERDRRQQELGIDVVEEASDESFPASDAPAWTEGSSV